MSMVCLTISSGIIPACAGSTGLAGDTRRSHRDHPRMRGEHLRPNPTSATDPGSSPHARGARVADLQGELLGGIIPACAGSTRWKRHWAWLPPRIIPACAGSTPFRTRFPPPARDHPRMRGEHLGNACDLINPWGSSPHARGARQPVGARDALNGIIPACAGSTDSPRSRACLGRDHPRMRGEHNHGRATPLRTRGSSPHARGAPHRDAQRVPRRGIIPACAGSTGA